MLCGVALVLSLVLQINVESSYFKNTAHVPVIVQQTLSCMTLKCIFEASVVR